jgi:hypothetical protein
MPFIPSQAKIILGGSGGSSANTATNAETASMLYNSQSLYGILQISNSNDAQWDVSASRQYSVLAQTSSVSASLIFHRATNITYSATNVLHTSSNNYEIKATTLGLYGGAGGGIKFFNNNVAISNSVLYTNASGLLKSIAGTQTGQIPIYNSSTGWTTALTSSLSVKNATTATTIAGILPVANGGTGRNTLTNGAILIGNGTADIDFLALPDSGSVIVTNATGWTTLPTGSLPTNTSTASYLKSPYSDNLYIGFTSSSIKQTIEIYANDISGKGEINLKAKENVNITSELEDINLSSSYAFGNIKIIGNAGITFDSPLILASSSNISIVGTPTAINADDAQYRYPVWNFSSSQSGRTASLVFQANRTQIICNVGSYPIYIDPQGVNSSKFILGVNSSSQLYCYNANYTLRLF